MSCTHGALEAVGLLFCLIQAGGGGRVKRQLGAGGEEADVRQET